jgi:hypothetical protein
MPKESILVFPLKPLVTQWGCNQGTDFCRNNDECVSDDLCQLTKDLVGAVLGLLVAHISQYFSATIGDGG